MQTDSHVGTSNHFRVRWAKSSNRCQRKRWIGSGSTGRRGGNTLPSDHGHSVHEHPNTTTQYALQPSSESQTLKFKAWLDFTRDLLSKLHFFIAPFRLIFGCMYWIFALILGLAPYDLWVGLATFFTSWWLYSVLVYYLPLVAFGSAKPWKALKSGLWHGLWQHSAWLDTQMAPSPTSHAKSVWSYRSKAGHWVWI